MDAQAKVTTVWVAYAIGILVTGTPFAGVLMAYFCRKTNDVPGVAGHNAAQIRCFWWAFLGWIVAFAMMAAGLASATGDVSSSGEEVVIGGLLLILGILFGIVVQIAFTIYSIIGIVRAARRTNWPGADPLMNTAAVFS